MWRRLTMLICVMLCLFFLDRENLQAQSFLNEQLNHYRVVQARNEKDFLLHREMEARGLPTSIRGVFIRIFKKEGVLELWMQTWDGSYVKFKDYSICVLSGRLGPKRRRGDKQIPEGFYHINKFNPQSNYYLSLGISYPNQSDRLMGGGGNLGGDIYIHGECTTIGCLPITNGKMKELYWITANARNNGQTVIPVHIFPYKFNNYRFDETVKRQYAENPRLLHFWDNLRRGYEYFEFNRRLPNVQINEDGSYSFW